MTSGCGRSRVSSRECWSASRSCARWPEAHHREGSHGHELDTLNGLGLGDSCDRWLQKDLRTRPAPCVVTAGRRS